MNRLLEHLPAIYQGPAESVHRGRRYHFLDLYLRAFEEVLLGNRANSLEQQIARIATLFDAERTPEEFLPWLAGWVALSLRAELSLVKRRRLVAEIASLYRIRGTRAGLRRVLELHLNTLVSVADADLPALQIGRHSTVGDDTYLGGGPEFLFQVTLAFSRRDAPFVESQTRLAREVIEMEKPAHSWYELKVLFPRFRIGDNSTVGVDTLLIPRSEDGPRAQETSHD